MLIMELRGRRKRERDGLWTEGRTVVWERRMLGMERKEGRATPRGSNWIRWLQHITVKIIKFESDYGWFKKLYINLNYFLIPDDKISYHHSTKVLGTVSLQEGSGFKFCLDSALCLEIFFCLLQTSASIYNFTNELEYNFFVHWKSVGQEAI